MTSSARRQAATPIPLWVATALFAVYCILLAASSSPTRVGDGVEYWAMAEQMRTGHRPSATRAELARLERNAAAIGAGFDRSPVRFPHLVGADGRQDFPHFWLYPLVNVPALALVSAAGVHPGWAFTLTNILLLAAAFAIVARRVSIPWAILLLAGPLVWWIDKAHGDVFTVTLLAAGCALWQTRPAWTAIAVALAAAQNPALMPVSAIVCLAACWPVIRATLTRRTSTPPSRAPHVTFVAIRVAVVVAVAASAVIVALPLAYYQIRLGVWSPLIGYTHPTWPSLRAIASLLADPNIGLLPNAPWVVVAGAWAIATRARHAIRGGDRGDRRPVGDDSGIGGGVHPLAAPAAGDAGMGDSSLERQGWLLAAVACVLMLAAFAQSVNLNHGATPGLNRWTLWLTPWLLLIVPSAPRVIAAARETSPTRDIGARVLVALAVLNIFWGAWFFRPSLPEVYRYPTMSASWLWRHAPGWYAPAPEIFAERVSHREPAALPVATPGCTKVLIIDGRWPASCVPTAQPPASCLGAERLCYATPSASTVAASATSATSAGSAGSAGSATSATSAGPVASATSAAAAASVSSATSSGSSGSATPTTFTPLGDVSFPWAPAARSWPGNAPFVAALRAALTNAGTQNPGELEPAEAVVRAANGVGWNTAWSGGARLAIYVQDVSPDASLDVRVDADCSGQLIDLDTGRILADITVARSAEQPTTIALPAAVQHGLIRLERTR